MGAFHDEAKLSKPDKRLSGYHRVKGMGEVVNLRRARKKSERQQAELKAAANRLLHGRSKAERMLDAERNAKSRRHLDRHRIKTGDDR